ncbi:calmodulin-lysine N-methyltransferase-like isoform X2 [Patiria miniata]|uniref:Calmodulin-lysine N-methyltransferase n=1 Tax=Patiria miniata TaxID=46514 RepID=A0A914BHB8_PATMI|nr:calmodulin-lysine N-methyltransferase-like isoform X2 [Patiria miniata]
MNMQYWAILQKQCTESDPVNLVSIRRFSTFGLFSTNQLPGKSAQGGHRWEEYTCPHHSQINVNIRHLSNSFSAGELIGFNNTGNVCLWPSEEVLAFHCMKNAELFKNQRLCELGGGMTCLAGIAVAVCSDAAEVLLTDGNQTSVQNVKEVLAENSSKFGHTSVAARELKWNQRQTFEDLNGHFDHVISADCLFFDQFRRDLVDTIDVLLKAKGVATIFAPQRGKTLDDFCEFARLRFTVEVDHKYDQLVWQKHQEMLIQGKELYDENIHYPVMITLTR